MKKKTYIQPGAYQKIPNTAGANIKGALNFNKEVLDTLVDKDVLSTSDCCSYFPRIPSVPPTQSAEDYVLTLPVGSLFMLLDEDGNTVGLYIIIQVAGVKGYGEITVSV